MERKEFRSRINKAESLDVNSVGKRPAERDTHECKAMNMLENNDDELLNPCISEIILYEPDNSIRLEVRVEDETVWLSLNQIAKLFDRDKSVISRHIANVFKEEELLMDSTVAKFATVQMEGGRMIERNVEYFNLDVIISVGYRVKSKRGTQFRQWANRVLKEYLLKGYAINQRIERVERFAIETAHRITEAEKKIDFLIELKQYIETVLADYNDINEDTRMQLELINDALAKLQSDHKSMNKPRNPIGFRTFEK